MMGLYVMYIVRKKSWANNYLHHLMLNLIKLIIIYLALPTKHQ